MGTYITQTYLKTARHIQQWLFPGLCCPLPVQHQMLPHLCLPLQFKTSKCLFCRHKELKIFDVYEIIKARVPEGLRGSFLTTKIYQFSASSAISLAQFSLREFGVTRNNISLLTLFLLPSCHSLA